MNKSKGLARLATAKGFTIIELIVVIAIIAILAAIVMVNVTQYIAKSKDAAAEADLSAIMTNAVVWNTDHTNYSNFITSGEYTSTAACAGDTTFTTPCTALVSSGMGYTVTAAVNVAGTPAGSTTAQYWCVGITLKDASTFCVDSTGAKKKTSTCGATGACS